MTKINKISKDELLEMAKTMTIQEIADKFNVSYVTIWKYLKKVGRKARIGRPPKFNITD